jgi:hypothetical protein
MRENVCEKKNTANRLVTEISLTYQVGKNEGPTMLQHVSFALRTIISIVLAAFSLQTWGSDCAPSDIGLSKQVEVDALSVSGCTTVTGDLVISGNGITSIEGLSNITSVGGDLRIFNNAALTSLDGLSNLTSLGGGMEISYNISLISLDGLSNITNVSGYLRISGNVALRNLDDLASLTSVGGLFFITNNTYLTNVGGLANLAIVDGYLEILGNATLSSLDGFSGLNSVGGGLKIVGNSRLTNVDGLSSLISVGQGLWITDNSVLSQCSTVSRLLDQWDDAKPGPGLGVGGFPDIGGEAIIRDNLAGCNSVEEILATDNPSKINPGLNDAWFNPETSGQGFFITVFSKLNAVSLAWFTYDTELPPIDATAYLGDPGHRWITAVGPIEGNQVMMDIEVTSGGLFDTPTEITRTDPPGSDGTIVLTFDSCNSGTIEYDIPSINMQGAVPIQRVANDNVVLCEALNAD